MQTTFLPENKEVIEKKLLKQTEELNGLLNDITKKKKYRRVCKLVEKFRQHNKPIRMGRKLKPTDLRGTDEENLSDYIRELIANKHAEVFTGMHELKAMCDVVLLNFTRDKK